MGGMQWVLEIALVGLLAATLFHALRLERALGVVKRDRADLETLVRSFNESTRQAESGVEKLRNAADGAGRHISRQIETAAALKDDLSHLVERGERLADRMDSPARIADGPARRVPTPEPEMAELAGPRVRSQAERDLLRALRVTR
jgi:hypothetical protein